MENGRKRQTQVARREQVSRAGEALSSADVRKHSGIAPSPALCELGMQATIHNLNCAGRDVAFRLQSQSGSPRVPGCRRQEAGGSMALGPPGFRGACTDRVASRPPERPDSWVTGRASARAFTSCGSTTVRVTAFITRRTVRRSSSSCAVAINEAKDIERAHAYWKD